MEPWIAQISAGNLDAAWDLFIGTYRPLILKTIRRTVSAHDDVMDAFAHVCAALSSNSMARLNAYHKQTAHTAAFSTWLVVVVRNQVVDWIRQQTGRPRVRIPADLSELESRVYELVFVTGSSHVEAYEQLRSERAPDMSFSSFLKILAAIHRRHGAHTAARPVALHAASAVVDETPGADQRVAAQQTSTRVREVLDTLEPDDRLAVQLFVLDELGAAEVARILGWPNAKTVYNRVYRTLAALRARLAAEGITPEKG